MENHTKESFPSTNGGIWNIRHILQGSSTGGSLFGNALLGSSDRRAWWFPTGIGDPTY